MKDVYDDRYLLELCFYIHMNPIKAKMVESLDDYPWSSHHSYLRNNKNDIVTTNDIQQILSVNFGSCGNPYLAYMQNRGQQCFQPEFCDINSSGLLTIKDSINNTHKDNSVLNIVNMHLNDIAVVIFNYFNLNIEHINSATQNRNVTLARALFAYFAHYHAHYTIKEIASMLNRTSNAVSKSMHGYLRRADYEKPLQKHLNQIARRLSRSDTHCRIF